MVAESVEAVEGEGEGEGGDEPEEAAKDADAEVMLLVVVVVEEVVVTEVVVGVSDCWRLVSINQSKHLYSGIRYNTIR